MHLRLPGFQTNIRIGSFRAKWLGRASQGNKMCCLWSADYVFEHQISRPWDAYSVDKKMSHRLQPKSIFSTYILEI